MAQKLRHDSDFCDFHITLWKRGPKASWTARRAWGPKGAIRRGLECPELIVSQYFLTPMGVLPRTFLHIGNFVRILMLHFPKSTMKNIFFENPKTYKFSRLIILQSHVFLFKKKKFLSILFGKCYIGYFFNKSNLPTF